MRVRRLADHGESVYMGYRVLVVDDSKLARMAVAKALTHSASRLDPRRGGQRRRGSALASKAMHSTSRSSTSTCRATTAFSSRRRCWRSGLALPLAVISANHQVEVVTRAREVGATFLQKPLTDKAMGRVPGRRGRATGCRGERRFSTSSKIDALTEMVNIGVGRAADQLARHGRRAGAAVGAQGQPGEPRHGDQDLERERGQPSRGHPPGVRGRHHRPGAADLPRHQEPRAGAGRHRRRAAASRRSSSSNRKPWPRSATSS